MNFLTDKELADLAYESGLNLNGGEADEIVSFKSFCQNANQLPEDVEIEDYVYSMTNVGDVFSPSQLEEFLEAGGYDEANECLFFDGKYMSLPQNFWDNVTCHGEDSYSVDGGYYLQANFK